MNIPRYIGLMSGTSMDGIDCALISAGENAVSLLDFISHPIPKALRERMLALCGRERILITDLGELDVELGLQFAEVVHHMLERNQLSHDLISAIGSHGQTLWHQPTHGDLREATPFTLQIADPNTICQSTRITTIADFRRKDMAAGGQGAPLVPAFHRELFQSPDTDRVVVNIGGMANVTLLSRDRVMPVQGHDTGPGNVLMDAWTLKNRGMPFDEGGRWAASGECHEGLLAHFLDEPYFALQPPKSTGRELFNADWLTEKLLGFGQQVAPEDVQATLMNLTARSIADSIHPVFPGGEVIVCGGGALNGALLEALGTALPAFRIRNSSDLQMPPEAMEAAAFAWMASRTLARKPIDFTGITGASEPGIAGGIYFYE